jgi:predicted permease
VRPSERASWPFGSRSAPGGVRIAQQFLAEALVLSLAGGVLGVILAALGVKGLLALEPGDLPRLSEVGVDWSVLAFALALSVVVAGVLGLCRRCVARVGTSSRRWRRRSGRRRVPARAYRVRGALVVAQMALTLVLLVGAGLLARSFLRLARIDPGYRTDRALVLDISASVRKGPKAQRERVRLYDEIIARLSALAGGHLGGWRERVSVDGRQSEQRDVPDHEPAGRATGHGAAPEARAGSDAQRRRRVPRASPSYFRAMNIPVIRGRVFEDRDAPDAPHVGVISQALAKAKWPNEDPIGKIIQYGNMDGDLRPFTVIGVVGDVREASLADPPRATFYANYRQRPRGASAFNFVVRAVRRPRRSSRRRAASWRSSGRTSRRASARSRRWSRNRWRTAGSCSCWSASSPPPRCLLATLGVYSVIAYVVTQRRQEIGVRVALGAQSADVLRMVLRQGFTLAFIGIAIGTVAALLVGRLLSRFLFGIAPNDPVAFGGVILVLAVVALLASFVPALRAARVDPMTALRNG